MARNNWSQWKRSAARCGVVTGLTRGVPGCNLRAAVCFKNWTLSRLEVDDERTTTSVPVSPRAQCIRSRVQRVGAEVRHNALQFTQIHEERSGDEVDLGCGIGAVVELRLRIRAGSLRDQSSEQIWQAACWCREVQLFEKMQEGLLSK